MPAQAIRLVPEPARTLAHGSIGASYMGVGTAFENPIRIIVIQNITDATLMFSFDGIDDHIPLPREGFILLDITANKSIEHGFYIPEGARIYVKQISAPTQGAVYVTAFHGAD